MSYPAEVAGNDDTRDRVVDELLAKWQEGGDPEALDRLLRNEVSVLKQMIRGRRLHDLKGSANTTDVAQDVVLKLLAARSDPEFASPAALRGYLWRIAWNLLVERLERKRVRVFRIGDAERPGLERFLESTTRPETGVEREERATAVEVALNLLRDDERELLVAVYFEGLDIASAAARLGVGRDVANTRLVRARRRLATLLSEWADVVA